MYKLLFTVGFIFMLLGVLNYFFGNIFNWVGKLPGDISYKKEHFSFYFPFTTMIILSLIINGLYKLWVKFS
ncbi:MAG TPA: DUF2905 domain-containing protein [Saprospiraceae bacterium]|nr:DUF2905 domain-containing protein [Saprospiraceae bacterium]